MFAELEPSTSQEINSEIQVRLEVINLCLFTAPLDLATADQDSHKVVRVLARYERKAEVDQFWEELVESDVLDLQVIALAVLQDSKEDPADFKEDILRASDGSITITLLL